MSSTPSLFASSTATRTRRLCGATSERDRGTGAQRNRKLLELVNAQHADEQGALPYRWEDLDPNAMLHLIVDSIDQKKDCVGDKRPYTKLMTELVCCLAATLPSLAMETGSGWRHGTFCNCPCLEAVFGEGI